MPPRSTFGLAEGLLLATALVWGTSYAVVKDAVVLYPVLGYLALRFCLTALLLAPTLRGEGRRAWRPGVPTGLLLLAIFLSETFGVALTSASNAAFLISLCVALTPFAEWWLLGQRPEGRALGAAALAVVGAGLLTRGVTLSFNLGDGLILLAAVLRAINVCVVRRRLQRASAPIPALALTAVQTGVVGLVCLLLFALGPGLAPLPVQPGFWLATGYLVLFCTLGAFLAQNYALGRTSATRVALLMGAEPLFGALFAAFWLDERLGLWGWLGGLLIVIASLWGTLPRRVVNQSNTIRGK
ncbi:DMT family transporter [Pseudomonas sp. No.117]